MQTVQNTSGQGPTMTQETSSAVETILGKDFLESGADTTFMKNMVGKLLDGDKQAALHLISSGKGEAYNFLPTKLKNDSEIIEALMQQDPQKYFSLDPKLKNKKESRESAITAFLKAGKSLPEILQILDEAPRNQKKNLQKYLDTQLESGDISLSVFEKILYGAYKIQPELYAVLAEKKIFQLQGRSFGWSDAFIAFIKKNTGNPATKEENPENSEELMYQLFLKFIGNLKTAILPELEMLLKQELTRIQIKKEKGNKDEPQDETDEEDRSSKQGKEPEDAADSTDPDFAYSPRYSYTSYGSTMYVSNSEGISVGLDEKELQNTSEKSLERYFKFYSLSHELGLGFLLTKHKSRIQMLTGVDFLEGEGMSEARTFKYLNNIGKNIGIPEESYEDPDGNRKIGCFQTLGAAKMHFAEVKDTGKIGKYNFDVSQKGDNTIVELYMKASGLIVGPFQELSVSRWK